ncbi:cytidine deaminase [Eupeodes corollae]|uniref:cytidine deaminase n=1 Tax=Eupeodes corollae TaxID=290404 RepID=UPI00249129C0|nr:cytidine deaminase [Eupeodes corollae]
MSGLFINGATDDASIKLFDELENSVQSLINAAIEARKNAYCPYSKFAVGAAIKTDDGSIYTGSNIENGAYSASLCAERVAVAKAISDGKRQIAAVAVVGLQEGAFTTPCGLCRQFLMEFTKTDFPIYVAKPINPPLRVLVTSINQLLPKSFKLDI